MNLKPGQYIHHFKYGNGTILERDDERIKIDFDTAGEKIFVTSLATFEVADGEAPKKKRPATRRRAKAAATA